MKIYEYKGQFYKVIRIANLKHPVTREWVKSYLYCLYPCGSIWFVREQNDFNEKFKVLSREEFKHMERNKAEYQQLEQCLVEKEVLQ
jgi:hypothetical protein